MTGATISLAHEHCRRLAWNDACDVFASVAGGSGLSPADLESWATAAYLTGRDDESTDAWADAFASHLERDEPERAVICAFWAAFGLLQRGRAPTGGAWLAEGHRLIATNELRCVGEGYLAVPEGLMCLGQGRLDAARDRFEHALMIAERHDDPDLRAMATLGRGQERWAAGHADVGARRFDEAMLAVTRSLVSPVVAGIIYCAVVDACQRAFDVRRAHEWTRELSRWCDTQPQLVSYRGQCLVHRSQVLQLHGDLVAAADDAVRAARWLDDPPRPAIGVAHYQLGELARLRGDLDDAEREYDLAQKNGRSPHPGLALVLLQRGDHAAAAAAIDTAIAGATDEFTVTECLPAAVEILIADERVEDAAGMLRRLEDIARRRDSEFLDALVLHAAGSIDVARGEGSRAMGNLRAACDRWRQLEAPHSEARARVEIAKACRATGDETTAEQELGTARRLFDEIGASSGVRWIETTSLAAERAADDEAPTDLGLTAREIQVLRRVGVGSTNRQIADELFISIKTVERHLSNIFVKLGAPNRAAATAIASDAGLLTPESGE